MFEGALACAISFIPLGACIPLLLPLPKVFTQRFFASLSSVSRQYWGASFELVTSSFLIAHLGK